MVKRWQDFERIIATIHVSTNGAAAVTWNEKINGRQFDVVVRFKYGPYEYLTVIECKDYARPVSVEKVDAFVTKSRGINASKAVIVAANGYQSGCIEVAAKHGVVLLTLHETADGTSAPLNDSTSAINVYRVRLINRESNEEFELEEWNGKLEYLMGEPIILMNSVATTPSSFIELWLSQNQPLIDESESRFDLDFPTGTTVKIPYEAPFNLGSIRFHCRLVIASKTNEPLLSRHIREFNVLKHELQNCITGDVIYSEHQRSLQIGFDTVIRAGEFYRSINGFMYYCEGKVDGLISWVLLESYQHGKFIQARFAQKTDDAEKYIRESDPITLRRLRMMLADFLAYPST